MFRIDDMIFYMILAMFLSRFRRDCGHFKDILEELLML